MRREENIKFAAWYKALKKAKIITSLNDLGRQLDPEKPIAQPFLSAMLNGNSAIPERIFDGIETAFPYTNQSYFSGGGEAMLDFHLLIKYLTKKHDSSLKQLVKELNNEYVNQGNISKIIDTEILQQIFDFINKKWKYKINVKNMLNAEGIASLESKNYKGKSPHVERLWELIDSLIKNNIVLTQKDFCERIGITKQQLSNTRSQIVKQDVTKDWVTSIARAFPMVSLDWLILGEGTMFRDPGSAMPLLIQIQSIVKESNAILTKRFS